jgi:DNA repair photolyase
MPLNKATGNMYPFVTHTWNPITGACPHECGYCYVDKIRARFKLELRPPRLVDFTPDVLGVKNSNKIKHIFVGSAIDIFARDIPGEWISAILDCCNKRLNYYLFQTKNPERYSEFMDSFPVTSILVTTLESNREYPKIYNLAPPIKKRVEAFAKIDWAKMITVEPVLDFDTDQFVKMIKGCGEIQQVNIGADSGHNHLPEPPPEKLREFIAELEKFTKVYLKKNLSRIYKE